MTGEVYYWVANWALSRAQAAGRLHGPVADMADCTHDSLAAVRRAYPTIKRFAGYITGTPGIEWTAADFASIPRDSATLHIDQSDQDLEVPTLVRVVKDVEPGASLPGEAALVAKQRLARGLNYAIYVDESELPAVEEAVAKDGLPAGRIVAYQFASPSSNPHLILPGTNLTLAQANADLSVVLESWLPLPAPPKPKPVPAPAPAPAPADRYDQGFQAGYHAGFDRAFNVGFDTGFKVG